MYQATWAGDRSGKLWPIIHSELARKAQKTSKVIRPSDSLAKEICSHLLQNYLSIKGLVLLRFMLIVLSMAFFSACSSSPVKSGKEGAADATGVAPQISQARGRGVNEVAPGFEIAISSVEDQNLNGKYRIDFAGNLKLPYNTTVQTEGLTRDDLRARINDAYAKFFKTPPKLGVTVVEEKYWIDVRGLVEKPARFLVQQNTSMDEALSMAGGLSKSASVRYVRLQQGKESVTLKLADYYSGSGQDKLPSWRGGDILFFQSDRDYSEAPSDVEKAYIQMMGEVRVPGEYRFARKSDFYDYLVRAGGPTGQANLGNVELIRNTPEGRVSSVLDLANQKEISSLQSGDLLIVHPERPTAVERGVSLFGGIVGVINTVLLVILLL